MVLFLASHSVSVACYPAGGLIVYQVREPLTTLPPLILYENVSVWPHRMNQENWQVYYTVWEGGTTAESPAICVQQGRTPLDSNDITKKRGGWSRLLLAEKKQRQGYWLWLLGFVRTKRIFRKLLWKRFISNMLPDFSEHITRKLKMGSTLEMLWPNLR